ncbi:hypothetical protein [Aurantibacter sp.]|uniref:hypothetical protein n=1 Tax=Aurantibacter sp. TaxID=2807103 RepID=UPI003266A5BE
MKNKVIWFTTPKSNIETKHVFNHKNQVFLKGNSEETALNENDTWYPINFQWIPVLQLKESLHK